MGQKKITLSGAATDVLSAMFFRGALQCGDLPSKCGAAELRALGFAETRHTATEYQKLNYFTFLTEEGQAFAIRHLVETRFGKPAGGYIGNQQAAGMAIGVEGDQSKVMFEADRYKVHEAVSSIIGNAVVTNAKMNIRLGDETKQAVIDAVRESDLFKSLQASLDAQFSAQLAAQLNINEAVNRAIRNALQPGGLLYQKGR